MIFLLLALLFLPEDGVIVLINGKTLKYRDSYEVEGSNIVFKNLKGDLLKLPMAMVDMPKTKQREEARKAAGDKPVKKAAPKKEVSEYERFVLNAKQTEDGEEGGTVVIVEGNRSSDGVIGQTESALGVLAQKASKVVQKEGCSQLRKSLVVAKRALLRIERRLEEQRKNNEDDTDIVTTLKGQVKAAKAAVEKIEKEIETCDK